MDRKASMDHFQKMDEMRSGGGGLPLWIGNLHMSVVETLNHPNFGGAWSWMNLTHTLLTFGWCWRCLNISTQDREGGSSMITQGVKQYSLSRWFDLGRSQSKHAAEWFPVTSNGWTLIFPRLHVMGGVTPVDWKPPYVSCRDSKPSKFWRYLKLNEFDTHTADIWMMLTLFEHFHSRQRGRFFNDYTGGEAVQPF